MSGNRLKGGVVYYMLAFGSVQIHQMESADSGILKAQRHVQRVVAVGLAGVVVTLGESYAFAVYYIYRRNDIHSLNVKKILKNALSCAAALLGVELGCVKVVLMERCAER